MVGAIAFAFGAGMVATANPCGFAMLPAYVSLLITDTPATQTRSGLRAGLLVGATITASFVATFGLVGSAFRFVNDAFVDALPWVVPVIGVGLVVSGILVLTGRRLWAPSVSLRTRRGSRRSLILFGLAYAVASVSCALPIFLAVITAGATASTVIEGVSVFVAYGLGMGVVLVTVAVAVATSRDAMVRRIRRLAPHVDRIGGWLMVASGVFVAYYWITVLATDIGSSSRLLGPIVFLNDVSAWLSTQMTENTAIWALTFVFVVAAVAVFEIRRVGRR